MNLKLLLTLYLIVVVHLCLAPINAIDKEDPKTWDLKFIVHENAIGQSVHVSTHGAIKVLINDKFGKLPGIRLNNPLGSWDLTKFEKVIITIRNTDSVELNISCWAVTNGWGGIGAFGADGSKGTTILNLKPGDTGSQHIYIHTFYKDNLHKMINPTIISFFDLRIHNQLRSGLEFEIVSVCASGSVSASNYNKSDRLIVPSLHTGCPLPGKRVKQQLREYNNSEVHHVLYLPKDWKPEKRYPVIAEFPPNVFFHANCYSTGKVEEAVNGFGISKGKGYIWVVLPFIASEGTSNEINGWGDAERTTSYAVKVLREICEKFGGDPAGIFITGFSRGAIATGYIGLRNEEIANIWIGFNASQHTDGDGWHGSDNGAKERIARLKGRSVFLIDNEKYPWTSMVPESGSELYAENSGLGAHTAANYLDNRPSTIRLRKWFSDVYKNKPGTYRLSGVLRDSKGGVLENYKIESGTLHSCSTDKNGYFQFQGLIKGETHVQVIHLGQNKLLMSKKFHLSNNTFIELILPDSCR